MVGTEKYSDAQVLHIVQAREQGYDYEAIAASCRSLFKNREFTANGIKYVCNKAKGHARALSDGSISSTNRAMSDGSFKSHSSPVLNGAIYSQQQITMAEMMEKQRKLQDQMRIAKNYQNSPAQQTPAPATAQRTSGHQIIGGLPFPKSSAYNQQGRLAQVSSPVQDNQNTGPPNQTSSAFQYPAVQTSPAVQTYPAFQYPAVQTSPAVQTYPAYQPSFAHQPSPAIQTHSAVVVECLAQIQGLSGLLGNREFTQLTVFEKEMLAMLMHKMFQDVQACEKIIVPQPATPQPPRSPTPAQTIASPQQLPTPPQDPPKRKAITPPVEEPAAKRFNVQEDLEESEFERELVAELEEAFEAEGGETGEIDETDALFTELFGAEHMEMSHFDEAFFGLE